MSHPEEIDIHAPPPLAAPLEAAPDPPRILQIPLLEDLHGEEQLGGDVTPVFDEVAFAGAGEGEQAVAEADGQRLPKLAEWEDWHSHRLTKVKKKGVWTGWQLTCCRHGVTKDLCSRERTIPKRQKMDPGSVEFKVASDRVVQKLKHWAVQELQH